ncbi:AAC(3) family N-acetyltransferase [Paenibacillus sp. CCS19]|uniref:aminoglycoside N(3)-acetyltransferase n=1 Tax=Paenibacillus sp. CCS19 TaxID=3158387 RepID=UPI00256C6FA8|nr:AAC(3) family N-acetyltransferase [Paenibacillus cellulosilyticus]GMK37835.1 AAC(3) family N-acetyltransferase [Paenibacillus cellulosilyticus]
MNKLEAESRAIWTQEDLIERFARCGVEAGQTLFVHASLSKLGFVVGGPETVIRALLALVGDEGTLVMPAQTWKNLDPATGVHWEEPQEWWPIIRAHWPAYDKAVTPVIGMGVIAEMLRTWPGACRSDHPARSVAAVGRHAAYITQEHDLCNIVGDGSPLDKVYRLDGKVLLIGVGYDKNTSLHLAEARANYASKSMSQESSAMLIDGERRWVTYETLAVNDEDFAQLGEAYDREMGTVVHRIGNAEIRLISQRSLVDWAVQWMEQHRL